MITNVPIRSARSSIIQPRNIININFLRTAASSVQKILDADLAEVDDMKREIALIEKGNLHIHYNSKREAYYYSLYSPKANKSKTINDEPDRIHMLARRDYLELKIREIEANHRRLEKVLNNISYAQEAEKFARKLHRYYDAHLDLCRILFTKEQNEWINTPYSPNQYHLEGLTSSTNGGIPVRSKSEGKIGSLLEDLGLPYRYDDIVHIKGGTRDNMPFRDQYFADFKAPNLIGGITVLEHLGAFNLNNYGDNALQRINDYTNFTIYEIPGRPVKREEIVWSLESDIRIPARLDRIIMRILFPGIIF